MLGEGFVKERQGARAQVRTRSEGNDASEVAPFLSMYLDGPRARLLLGFAAFSAWVNLLIGFEGFLRDTVVYGGRRRSRPAFRRGAALGRGSAHCGGLAPAAFSPAAGRRRDAAMEGRCGLWDLGVAFRCGGRRPQLLRYDRRLCGNDLGGGSRYDGRRVHCSLHPCLGSAHCLV